MVNSQTIIDLLAKLETIRYAVERWQHMLILADAIEDAGGDGRGWRWIASQQKQPNNHRNVEWDWFRESIVKDVKPEYYTIPIEIFEKLKQNMNNLRPIVNWMCSFSTRLIAEQAVAEAWILCNPRVN